MITNPSQFFDIFGGFHQDYYLAYAINHFFTEGGRRCYVVRVFAPNTVAPAEAPADVARTVLNAGTTPALRVLAVNAGSWGNALEVEITPPAFDPTDKTNADQKFGLKVYEQGSVVETFAQLSMKEFTSAGLPNAFHVEAQINGVSKYIQVDDLSEDPSIVAPPDATASPVSLAQGSDGQAQMNARVLSSGLSAFDVVDDINIVAIPDLGHSNLQGNARAATLAGFTYCENRRDCFFVADAPPRLTPQEVLGYKRGTDPFSGNAFNSTYGALYYPWIYATDPLTGKRILLPPSGAVVGSYSATDVRRGVHKAPAGITDGFLNTAMELRVCHQGGT